MKNDVDRGSHNSNLLAPTPLVVVVMVVVGAGVVVVVINANFLSLPSLPPPLSLPPLPLSTLVLFCI